MDGIGITVRKKNGLISKLSTALSKEKDTLPILNEWLVECIEATFKERSNKKKGCDFSLTELIDELLKQGIQKEHLTDKTSYSRSGNIYSRNDDNAPRCYTVQFNNFTVKFNIYSGGNSNGPYKGIYAYFFNTFHSTDMRFTTVEEAATALKEIDRLIPQWKSELWPEILLEAQKIAKIKSINENTIETLIKTKLTGTGITYHLEKQKVRVKVFFNIGCDMQIEWFILHKTFMKDIDNVINAVVTIKKTVETTGSTFTAKRLDKSINWK